MQFVSWDKLHEMLSLFLGKNEKKIVILSSAELMQRVVVKQYD